MDRQLFIYWHLATEHQEPAVRAVREWQQGLRRETPGLVAQLFTRANPQSERSTVMETYALSVAKEGVPAAMERRLVDEGDALTTRWRDGPRHVEVFIACD
jgi:Domain of unknown function (DUF4936)